MQELITEFEKLNGGKCDLAIASSGKLTAQIQHGAPFDLFVSADTDYPYQLYEDGLALTQPVTYGHGKLILCSISSQDSLAFNKITLQSYKKIAIANPELAPYGKASIQALEKVWPDFHNRLIYGESIGQTTLFIQSGAVEAGITAQTAEIAITERGGKCVSIDPALYTPIAQAAVVLSASKQQDRALEFQKFLLSDRGKEILDKFGYNQ